MAAKRRWAQWPRRLSQELNGLSGLAGIGGVAVGAGSLTFLGGTAALACTGVGVFVVVGAMGYALVKGFPPAIQNPEQLVGKVINVDQLSDVEPYIPKLSIIGPSQAGKTTLRNRLSLEFLPITRTQETSAYVISLQTTPPSYLAVLDGGGERFAQQFRLAEICDYLCVVIDHNKSDTDSGIDVDRLSEHGKFLNQIRHHLDESNAKVKRWTLFIVNKRDLWVNASLEERTKLDNFCKGEVEKWKQGRRASRVEFEPHSNNIADDVARFMSLLKKGNNR